MPTFRFEAAHDDSRLEKGELDECVEELRRHLAGAEESLLEAIAIPHS